MDKLNHRKAKKAIRLTDAQGKPIIGQAVHCKLVNHEFLFGCGAFESLPYANICLPGGVTPPAGIPGPKPDPARLEDRMAKWLGLFNYGTLPFYWARFEPEEGKIRTAEYLRASEFLRSKDVAVKGHPLCWHTASAQWLLKYDNETILRKQLERIYRDVADFKGLVDMWDVINEVVIMPIYDKYDNPVTRLCKMLGRVKLIKTVFDAAHETNPDADLLINDFNLSTNYEILIDGCLNAGTPIHTIGLQSHQHQGVWGREKADAILARFEHFGLPLHFTENTIVAGPLVAPEIDDLQDAHYDDDAATPEYEAMQAEALVDMYRNLFENHPLVTAITNWDFGDGAWLNAPSGVIRKDGSLKPSYHALHDLIHREWSTDVTLCTDENGVIELEGFKGKYQLDCGALQGKVTLTAGAEGCEAVVMQ